MAAIEPAQLWEILSDLGPDYALPDEGITALCYLINGIFLDNRAFCQKRRDATPHRRMAWLQQVARTTKKLQELLNGRDFDIQWEIDRMHGHPQTRMPLIMSGFLEEIGMSSQELIALMAVFGPIATPMFDKEEFPSRRALKATQRIKKSCADLVALAESGISCDQERKDSKRKNDVLRYLLIQELAKAFEDTFKRGASVRREGEWPVFLSRVLSILENKETTPDAAYEALLRVNEMLRLKEQYLARGKQRQTPLSNAL